MPDGSPYAFSVAHSAWRGGKGDVVRDFLGSRKKHGLGTGNYYSIAANEHLDRLNVTNHTQIVLQQLEELWGEYGDDGHLIELWFDGGIPNLRLVAPPQHHQHQHQQQHQQHQPRPQPQPQPHFPPVHQSHPCLSGKEEAKYRLLLQHRALMTSSRNCSALLSLWALAGRRHSGQGPRVQAAAKRRDGGRLLGLQPEQLHQPACHALGRQRGRGGPARADVVSAGGGQTTRRAPATLSLTRSPAHPPAHPPTHSLTLVPTGTHQRTRSTGWTPGTGDPDSAHCAPVEADTTLQIYDS